MYPPKLHLYPKNTFRPAAQRVFRNIYLFSYQLNQRLPWFPSILGSLVQIAGDWSGSFFVNVLVDAFVFVFVFILYLLNWPLSLEQVEGWTLSVRSRVTRRTCPAYSKHSHCHAFAYRPGQYCVTLPQNYTFIVCRRAVEFVDNAKRFHQAGIIQNDSFFGVKSFQKDYVTTGPQWLTAVVRRGAQVHLHLPCLLPPCPHLLISLSSSPCPHLALSSKAFHCIVVYLCLSKYSHLWECPTLLRSVFISEMYPHPNHFYNSDKGDLISYACICCL